MSFEWDYTEFSVGFKRISCESKGKAESYFKYLPTTFLKKEDLDEYVYYKIKTKFPHNPYALELVISKLCRTLSHN